MLNTKIYDEIIRVNNDDALGTARRAAREEGLLVIIPFFGERAAGPDRQIRPDAAYDASMISKSCVISAVSPSMIDAEQYFSLESLMARETASGFSAFPLTRK